MVTKCYWLADPSARLPMPDANRNWRQTGENINPGDPHMALLIKQGCIVDSDPAAKAMPTPKSKSASDGDASAKPADTKGDAK